MADARAKRHRPEMQLSVELDPSLAFLVDPEHPVNGPLRNAIAHDVTELMGALGIPGHAALALTALNPAAARQGRCMRVFVNGLPCRYPESMMDRVLSYVTGALYMKQEPGKVLSWLREAPETRQVLEFLRLACVEAVKRHPSHLMHEAQAAAYLEILETVPPLHVTPATWPPSPEWAGRVLRGVLDLGIALRDPATVRMVLTMGLVKNQSVEDIVEDLVVALRPTAVEIQVPWDYLESITSLDDGVIDFAAIRDGLFVEIGIEYPEVRFTPVDTLRPHSFAFTINDVPTLPWTGLAPDQCLVTPAMLGGAATNPATGQLASVHDRILRGSAEAARFIVSTPLNYLVLCAVTELRAERRRFVHREAVQSQLDKMGHAFPALVTSVRSHITDEQITRVLRELVTDGLSVRNLRAVLEAVERFDFVVVDSARELALDERLPTRRLPDNAWLEDAANIAAFVRIAMRRELSYTNLRGTASMSVSPLTPELNYAFEDGHGWALENTPGGQSAAEKVLEVVRALIAETPAGSTPAILASHDARRAVRELTRFEQPALAVIALLEVGNELKLTVQAPIGIPASS